jgi:cytochrome P450
VTIAPAASLHRRRLLRRRYGDAFTIDLPVFGRSVVVSSPELVKQVFRAPPDVLAFGTNSPLGEVLGPGSLFSMDGDRHLRERRLILPAFHGERMRRYEAIIEEEARREMAGWPEGRESPTLRPFMRITLRSILRAVFGAQGHDVAELAAVLPALVALGSRLTLLPALRRDLGPFTPGRRGRWSACAGTRRSSRAWRAKPPTGRARCARPPSTRTSARARSSWPRAATSCATSRWATGPSPLATTSWSR